MPPTTIIAAEYDGGRSQSEGYANRLKEAGNWVEKLVLPGQAHETILFRKACSNGKDPAIVAGEKIRSILTRSKHYIIVVVFKTKPGEEQTFKEFLKSIIKIALESSGCLKHDLHQSIDDPTMFMFYEDWINKEAHEQHIARLEVQEWRAKLEGFLEQPYEVSIWEKSDK